MKKSELLKIPYTWEERCVLIKEKMLYIPPRLPESKEFTFPGWNDPELFGNDQPVCVEYCSGTGAWISEKAAAHPEINWVAVEIKFDRARKVWAKIERMQLKNLFVIWGDGRFVTKNYFAPESISAAYINFPDPWPKNRHAKNRIIDPEFLKDISICLKKDSVLTFVTDDAPYSDWFVQVANEEKRLHSAHPSPYYTNEFPGYGSSYFEQLWKEQGRTIRYHQFKKHEST